MAESRLLRLLAQIIRHALLHIFIRQFCRHPPQFVFHTRKFHSRRGFFRFRTAAQHPAAFPVNTFGQMQNVFLRLAVFPICLDSFPVAFAQLAPLRCLFGVKRPAAGFFKQEHTLFPVRRHNSRRFRRISESQQGNCIIHKFPRFLLFLIQLLFLFFHKAANVFVAV